MRLRVSAAGSLLTMVLVVSIACSEFQGPTSPSAFALPAHSATADDGAVTGSIAQAARMVVNWACLSTGVGCPLRAAIVERGVSEVVPSVPFNLSFSLVTTTVTLVWNVAQVGDPPASFVIEAGSVSGANDLAVFDTGNTGLAVTVNNVPSGTYYVRVRARNASGVSGPSNEVVVIVGAPGPCPSPSAPTGLTASVSGMGFTLQWSAIAGALAYVVEAGSTSGASNLAVLDTGTSASSYGGTAPAGTYYARVRARTACGTSGPSNEVVFTISPAPPGPGQGFTGGWLGLSPDGISVLGGECQPQLDLLLDLVQSGSTLSGTAFGRVRQVAPGGDCEEDLGVVRTFSILRGTVSGTAVAFSLEAGGADPFRLDFTGTVSGNRMSGTILLHDDPGNPAEPPIPGTWAVVRQ